MALREKYNSAIQTAKTLGFQGGAEERDGKLYFKGTTQTQDQANKIWDAIKTVPSWQQEAVADIKATRSGGASKGERPGTVKLGDTPGRIGKEMPANSNAYMDIFNTNRSQLRDPAKIK